MLEGTVHFQSLVPHEIFKVDTLASTDEGTHTFFTTPQLQAVQVILAAGRCEKASLNGCRAPLNIQNTRFGLKTVQFNFKVPA